MSTPDLTVKTESRRRWLLQRLSKLTQEITQINAELLTYEIAFDDEEIATMAGYLFEAGSCPRLTPVEQLTDELKAALPIIELPSKRWYGGKLDGYTEAIMKYLIDKDQYYTTGPETSPSRGEFTVDISQYLQEPRLELADMGVALVTTPTDDDVVVGQIVDAKVTDSVHKDKIQSILQTHLDTNRVLTTIPKNHVPYQIVVTDPQVFTETFGVKLPTIPKITNPALMVTQTPRADYIAKIGPRGRIDYRQDLSKIISYVTTNKLDTKPVDVMHSISELAMAMRSDDGFIYVCYRT